MVSLVMHAGLVLMGFVVMGGPAGVSSSHDAGDAGDMTVTLVDPVAVGLSPSRTAGSLQALVAKSETGAPPVIRADRKGDDLDQFMQALSSEQAVVSDPRVRQAMAEDQALDRRLTASDSRKQDDGDGASGGGGLWGLVAPCWKSLALRSATPVILDVALDARGLVSTPPQIIRPPGTVVDERQLQAEARALSALSTCMTRREPRFGGQVFRLNFPPPRP